jgi:hypothetical protein
MSWVTNYAKGVGAIYACQLAVQLYIADETNEIMCRKYGEIICAWLGMVECTVDELVDLSFEKSKFILQALTKYNPIVKNPEICVEYAEAKDSLQYQITQYVLATSEKNINTKG